MAKRSSQNASSSPSQAEPKFALRFISGKYQGGEFPIGEGQEIIIGRSSDLDMVLVEEMVSRKHARIELQNGVINIEDLGSTNGTFVNGEKVQKGTLREGDRVLIGTNILKVIAMTPGAVATANLQPIAVGRETVRQRMRTGEEAPRMSGNLEEIPLPDLLQLFSTSRKSGVLVLRTPSHEGRIYLDDGKVRYACIDVSPAVLPLKAVYRMLDWRTGMFMLDPPEEPPADNRVDATAQEILMEGFRQQDEFNAIRDRLPPLTSRITLQSPLVPKLRDLKPEELDLLQAALDAPSIEALFDAVPATDLATAQSILDLMKRGYLSAS